MAAQQDGLTAVRQDKLTAAQQDERQLAGSMAVVQAGAALRRWGLRMADDCSLTTMIAGEQSRETVLALTYSVERLDGSYH